MQTFVGQHMLYKNDITALDRKTIYATMAIQKAMRGKHAQTS